ncbi:hypothetical protein M8J76_007768 [Diaphorina citri]|nr:hypothetical protein M8J76_007768 [Diaphorina citri]
MWKYPVVLDGVVSRGPFDLTLVNKFIELHMLGRMKKEILDMMSAKNGGKLACCLSAAFPGPTQAAGSGRLYIPPIFVYPKREHNSHFFRFLLNLHHRKESHRTLLAPR